MLELPWPPLGPGPQQPRDAHRQHWANDACRRPPTGASAAWTPSAGLGADASGREPAVRHRTDGLHRGDVADLDTRPDRRGHDHRDRREHPGGEPDRPGGLPARWVPAEEWIPDPTPAPEQRWTPEQDWAAAFGPTSRATQEDLAEQVRTSVRRRRVAAVVALAVAAVLVVVALTVV